MPSADARAWIDLDIDAMRANYDTIRRSAGAGTAIIPMVKADAYGLGLEATVRTLEPLEPWGFGVATAVEGAAVRRLGVARPVLVVAPLPSGAVELAARSRLTASISTLEGLDAWIAAAARAGGEPLDFHVEVDTGMGRTGFDWRERGEWASALVNRLEPCVRWTGCFTHFHSADSPDEGESLAQWERFRQTLVQLPVPAADLLVHAANSAAALRWPRFGGDAVRPGIFLYGGHPAPRVLGVPEPRRVAAVKSRLALVRDKASGSTVGYGATYTAQQRERWGTVSIGYGDGVPRALGNRATVLVRGTRVPVIGRVSMDLITVSLRTVPDAEVGDVVTLIGEDGGDRITVDDVASLVDTISYEILAGLGRRLPRIERRNDTEGGR
jgi:alanine racemase